MHYKTQPRNVHCFLNISIVETKPQHQHITYICVLQITCACNMRFAAAGILIKKKSRQSSQVALFSTYKMGREWRILLGYCSHGKEGDEDAIYCEDNHASCWFPAGYRVDF